MDFLKNIASPQAVLPLATILLVTLYILRKLFLSESQVANLQDKFVLITGCDSGFGKMAALRLDQLGCRVLATCLTSQGEKTLAEEGSKQMKVFRLDVTKSEQVKEVLNKVKDVIPTNQGLWCVINNAGIAQVGPIDWVSLERFKFSADVNLWGMIDVSKTFLPLIKQAKGRVVNIISIAGRACLPNAVAYSISKYGAEAFSDALRREMRMFGVKVCIVEPGFFRTPMTNGENLKNAWSNLWSSVDKETKEEYGEEYYKASVDGMLDGIVNSLSSPHCYKVIDAIQHAVTSTRPKSRYMIGWDIYFLWIWVAWLPTEIGDRILRLLAKTIIPRSQQC